MGWELGGGIGSVSRGLGGVTPEMNATLSLEKTSRCFLPANARVELRPPTSMLRGMALTLDQIVEESRQWPEDVVAELVDRIMIAKHGGLPSEIDAAWRDTAHRRLVELESGQVQGVPLEETLAKARAILGR